MDLLSEYINKKLNSVELENELLELISKYNKLRNTYLFLYSTAMNKQIPGASLDQTDYYIFYDMLKDKNEGKSVDVYIETPGGSGEAAEEIVRFLHGKFKSVSFVISGEAKSAGTLMTLSGNEILMTETGSLGPIDAQIRIGRSVISAYDYIEWVDNKRKEAEETKRLNPVDATMIAQITPGEYGSVFNALKFAEDLVADWLFKYKFKNWDKTETRQEIVTKEMKQNRASEIASELINHSMWRSHGRSIKIQDLENIGLRVTKIDNNAELADIVYRIQTICRLLFDNSSIYKIFATEKSKIFKQAISANSVFVPNRNDLKSVEMKIQCQKCGKEYKIYGKFVNDSTIDKKFQEKGYMSFPKDFKLLCECGYIIDLLGIKNDVEIKAGKKLI